MNDLDKKIRDALRKEDAELFAEFGEEPSLFEMAMEVFRGRNRWLTILAVFWGIAFMALGVLAVVRFFQAEVIRDMLMWAGAFVFCMMAVAMMKLWHWMEIQRNFLTREIKRVNRLNEPLAMILIDVDDFKGLNDRFGHAAGDEILERLARIMESSVRETDLLARYGGEEFAIIASNTDLQGAYQLAEKIRTNIAETSFTIGDALRTMRITVSIGVAKFEGNRKQFFLAADRALYCAKADGKNCVVVD